MLINKNAKANLVIGAFKRTLATYGEIFLVTDWRFGGVVAALTFIHPNVGFSGLIALLVTLLLGYGIGVRQDFDWDSALVRNVVLIGLSLGYVFRLELKTLPLIVSISAAVFFLTIVLKRLLGPPQLPVMSLSFALMNVFLGVVTQNYDHIYQLGILHQAGGVWGPESLPEFINGFCNAMSYVVFINNFWVGAGISLLILVHSRLLFLAMLLSYLFGVSLQALKIGNFHAVFLNPESYNFIYAGALVSVIFLIPSGASLLMGALAVLVTNLFYDGLSQGFRLLGLRPSALPFNLAVLGLMHGLIYYRSKWRNLHFGRTPEQSIERLRAMKERFGYPDIALDLPFNGSWLVSQGFSGTETHVGSWRYALDFKKFGENGAQFSGKGLELKDYPGFGAEIFAPCSGYVVALENGLADNEIGLLDEYHNWGNFIIIRNEFGIYVSLCHLKQNSICVKVGAYVTKRQLIAACGNSGYSAEPHLHMQAQIGPYFDSPTTQFRLSAYAEGDEVKYYAIPSTGAVVRSFDRNLALEYALVWASGRKFRFVRDQGGVDQTSEIFEITACKDEKSGRSYLSDGAESRLYFWNQDGVFYFYDYSGSADSILAKIFLCIPRVPLTYSRSLGFKEYYPLDLAWSGMLRWWMQLGRMMGFSPEPKGAYKLDPSGTVLTGKLRFQGKFCTTEAVIDPTQGIKSIRIGDDHFRQCA